MKKLKREFWVTNISFKKDVALADLRLTIRKGESRNLLDSKHYKYTLDELQKSAESGSIKAKSVYIKVRDVEPHPVIEPGIYVAGNGRFLSPLRSPVEVEKPFYEELEVRTSKELDEQFANEEAELVDVDNRPLLPVDKDKWGVPPDE